MKRTILGLTLANVMALGISVSAAPVPAAVVNEAAASGESMIYVNDLTNAVFEVAPNGELQKLNDTDAQDARNLLNYKNAGEETTLQEVRIVTRCRTFRGRFGRVHKICNTFRRF